MSDTEHAILNLSPDEKRAFAYLFQQADKDQLGVVTGENAVSFFERTNVSPNVLGEIWQIADTENRGLLTKPGFCMVLRLIGHYQAGREPSAELAFKPAPVPRFEGLTIPGGGSGPAPGAAPTSPTSGAFPASALQPQLSGQGPIRVPPLDPAKVQQYSGLFERSGAQNGLLDGGTAKAIFERAGLPNEVLGRIWMAADREQRGSLDQTEFIVAMHLLTSMKSRSMTALPNVLPQGLWDAAARKAAPPSRQPSGPPPQAIPRQLTGQGAGPPRTQSPLARPPNYGTPQPLSAQTSGPLWLVTPADKAKFDQFFNTIDTQGRGIISGEQAVQFFSDSRLPEETLAQIWDLSDINSEGQLNKDEFAVAMYLIRQQRAPNAAPLPAFLPPALIPPSLRKQTQQTESTAPVFNNAAQAPNMPKSAADDLFGLDEPAQSATQAPVLQPQGTGMSATKDPFAGASPAPGSPASASPARFPPPGQQPGGSMFKPFMPTSAFGASLASQNTGSSMASNQPPATRAPPPTANDDLLGDNDTHAAEASKITNETSELGNMSTQIGNLRSQMEQTQSKKNTSQAELNQTNAQKRDLEIRLQQFRTQYEQEVRAVKEIEQQLTASRDSTKKLGQELAMLEGTHQDLQTQHQSVSQQLQADQQENATLKQRIAEINAEVAKLKPEIEKMKLDARQQKGMVSINKKQLATQEAERDRLQAEKAELQREAAEREEQARSAPVAENVAPASTVASPAASTLSSTNPFFRKASDDGGARAISPQQTGSGPTPSAFDALFGPPGAFAPSGQTVSRTGTPPATSFVGRSIPAVAPAGMSDSVQSISSAGQHTPSATPPLSDQAKDSPAVAEPPPPPEGRQFTSSQLPVIDPDDKGNETDASSTKVLPPASRAGGTDTPRDDAFATPGLSSLHVPGSFAEDPRPETAAKDGVPGAFPEDPWGSSTEPEVSQSVAPAAAKDDFDSAFDGFGESNKSKDADHEDPFATSSKAPTSSGFGSEFPPIRSLEHDDEDSDSSDDDAADRGFDDNFTAASPPRASAPVATAAAVATAPAVTAVEHASSSTPLPSAEAQHSPPAYEDSNKPSHGGSGERTEENQFPAEFGGLLPAREDPTSPPPPHETPAALTTTASREVAPDSSVQTPVQTPPATASGTNPFPQATATTVSTAPAPAAKNAFDDFDAFDDLAEAKEADKSGSDFDFGFVEGSSEFNPTFDSPAASMTTGAASSHQTPVAANRSLHQTEGSGSNGYSSFSSFQPSQSTAAVGSANSSIQQTPQNAQHDWDAIFSGLDNSKQIDTSFDSSDPWGAPANGATSSQEAASSAPKSIPIPPPPANISSAKPSRGGAITPGTEHDDPILKRLTGMGYPRGQALEALERYDYDINKAVDHLSSQ
ncbi:putative calcium-binding protein [Pseudocercospora fuligena]|uniref:Putative calcium-binding protein n=1 Tax=Pseudocercospora fuligena TaxID=685502 RepID=A0A8H6RKV2_9PEZI|nr:putative calcium-binding protein [Pseudocercospora fuligena]